MRIFSVVEDKFKEYKKINFQTSYEETILENWLEKNPEGILEDGDLMIIGRQTEPI